MVHDDILLPTDGSDPAKAATKEAMELIDPLDATLHAVYALEIGEPAPKFEDPNLIQGVDTKAGMALDSVQSAATKLGFEHDIVWSVVRGPTAESILKYATNHDIDLIVMGTHARTGVDRLIIGSIAEHVIRESPAPVLTVRGDNVSKAVDE
jgi:nucleotide-binding universal stress UspA family protein